MALSTGVAHISLTSRFPSELLRLFDTRGADRGVAASDTDHRLLVEDGDEADMGEGLDDSPDSG